MARWNERVAKLYQQDETGKYQYIGRWYVPNGSGKQRTLRAWAIAMANLLALGAMLALPAPALAARTGSYNLALALLIPSLPTGVLAAYYTWRLARLRFRLKEEDDAWPKRAWSWCGVAAIAELLLAAATARSLLATHSGFDAVLLGIALAVCVCNALGWKWLRCMTWDYRPNSEGAERRDTP